MTAIRTVDAYIQNVVTVYADCSHAYRMLRLLRKTVGAYTDRLLKHVSNAVIGMRAVDAHVGCCDIYVDC